MTLPVSRPLESLVDFTMVPHGQLHHYMKRNILAMTKAIHKHDLAPLKHFLATLFWPGD